jgi:hypothetical protein
MANIESFLRLETDRPHHLLVLHWQDFVPSETYREGMMEGIQVSRREGMENWIMDMKHMKVIRQADQEWTIATWFSQFQLLGIKRLAFVVSDDIFNQMAVSSMIAALRPRFQAELEYFQELPAAQRWVQENGGNSSVSSLFSVK